MKKISTLKQLIRSILKEQIDRDTVGAPTYRGSSNPNPIGPPLDKNLKDPEYVENLILSMKSDRAYFEWYQRTFGPFMAHANIPSFYDLGDMDIADIVNTIHTLCCSKGWECCDEG